MQPRILLLPRHQVQTKGLQCLMCPTTRVCGESVARILLARLYSQRIASNFFTLVKIFVGIFSPALFPRRGLRDQVSVLDVWGKQHLAARVAEVATQKSAAGLFWPLLCWRMATWLLCFCCWAATWSAPVVAARSWGAERLNSRQQKYWYPFSLQV